MRTRTLTLTAVLVSALTLTACQTGATNSGISGDCDPTLAPGTVSDQVKVEATDGEPTVQFEQPLVASEPQATISGGEGRAATAGTIVSADYVVYSAKNGATIVSSYGGALQDQQQAPAEPLRMPAGGESIISQALLCTAAGSTAVLATTVGELFNPQASSPELDITPADTAIVVLEVDRTFRGRAEGAPQPGVAGMPAIALAPNGRPGVTFPGGPAPAELKTATTIRGDGEAVADGDTLLLQYTGIIWETEEIFDSSWESGRPAEFVMDREKLIPGFVDAVVGQPIGSQVVVSIPQELGYNDPATRPQSIGEGQHLLFVIDILDRLEPAAG